VISGILAMVPIVTGVIGLLGISDPLYASAHLPAHTLLDSNLRFFSGVWLGIGIAMLWIVPRIEKETVMFRALWGMIFVGGIGRLISMLALSAPPAPFVGFTALEIIGAPFFVFWQARIAEHRA
jgi:hypothetical protein